MPAADVSVVIVSWNTVELLRRCLESLRRSRGVTLQVIVVDNGSSDGSVAAVREHHPEATLIESGANRGFAFATNLGLARATGRFVAWLNSDCEVRETSFAELVSYLDAHGEVGAVGPALVYANGRLQPSAQAFPVPARLVVRMSGVRVLMRSRILRALLRPFAALLGDMARDYVNAFERARAARSVDWVTGACLVSPAAFARQVGPLDEGYFMYCEDTDWCRRVHDAGREVHYVPTTEVVHHVGGSAGGSPFVSFQHHRSLLRYFLRWQPSDFAKWKTAIAAAFMLHAIGGDFARLFGAPEHAWWRLRALCLSGVLPEDPLA